MALVRRVRRQQGLDRLIRRRQQPLQQPRVDKERFVRGSPDIVAAHRSDTLRDIRLVFRRGVEDQPQHGGAERADLRSGRWRAGRGRAQPAEVRQAVQHQRAVALQLFGEPRLSRGGARQHAPPTPHARGTRGKRDESAARRLELGHVNDQRVVVVQQAPAQLDHVALEVGLGALVAIQRGQYVRR